MKNLFIFIFIIFVFGFLYSVVPTQGATVNLTCTDAAGKVVNTYPWCSAGKTGGIAGLVLEFYQIALGASGVLALGVLIYAGISWTLSGVITQKQNALELMQGAGWGLLLLASAYLILNTINPSLVKLDNLQLNCDAKNQASCEANPICRWDGGACAQVKMKAASTSTSTGTSRGPIISSAVTGLTPRCCYAKSSKVFQWFPTGENQICEDLEPLSSLITARDSQCIAAGLPKP